MASGFRMVIDRRGKRVLLMARDVELLTRRSIRHGWFALGADLKRTANKEILRKPKSGRVYYVRGPSGRRRRHVASAPGETHANLSGALRKSLSWKVRGHHQLEFGYGVDDAGLGKQNAPPWAQIEFGWGRVKARPSLQISIKATNRNAIKYFTERFGP